MVTSRNLSGFLAKITIAQCVIPSTVWPIIHGFFQTTTVASHSSHLIEEVARTLLLIPCGDVSVYGSPSPKIYDAEAN